MRRQRGVGRPPQPRAQRVLQHGAADGDAQHLAVVAEEGAEGGRDGDVGGRRGGLVAQAQRGIQDPQPDARRQPQRDPRARRAVRAVEDEQADARRGQQPAAPDGPAVAAGAGDEDAADDGGGGDGEGPREEADAGLDGGEVLGRFEVEGHVEEDAPLDDAVDDEAEVRGEGGAGFEEAARQHGLCHSVLGPEGENEHSNCADSKRGKRTPVVPRVHCTALTVEVLVLGVVAESDFLYLPM